MIHYSCDRCRAPIGTPRQFESARELTEKECKQGISLLLPAKTSNLNYNFSFTHLCEPCLGELAVWKNAKMVDHTLVDDR